MSGFYARTRPLPTSFLLNGMRKAQSRSIISEISGVARSACASGVSRRLDLVSARAEVKTTVDSNAMR